jgi:hypothetical protein
MPTGDPPNPVPYQGPPSVSVNAPSAQEIHVNERRQTPNVHIHTPDTAEAGLWKYIPASMRPWVGMGILGIFVGLFLTQWYDNRDERRQERAEARADRAEDRETMRAGISAQERRSGLLEDKLDAISVRIEASATEMRASRVKVESVANELRGILDQLIATFKKPIAVIMRSLPTVEVAPMPRKVSPAGSR